MEDKKLLDKLLGDFNEKALELKQIYKILLGLQKYDSNIAIPDLAVLLGSKELDLGGGRLEIKPDDFYGLSNTGATEKYLRKRGHAVPLDEIFNALKEGGTKLSSANAKNNLNIQLTRATRKFAKIQSGNTVSFGLLEFYPHRKKSRLQEALTKKGDIETQEKEEAKED